ncbi:hypothetical protein CU665_15675 [Pseudomonas syringae pv. actinidifoliorum]|nr:hypothetical protein [Pseudomonas syringae pv. theae]MBL3833077.1 hypothetical protein [Pseudomonas syringae pv. theae]MBL3866433.1 hypothetical protein [Pseudomonas syringae pv. theae]NAT24228.1 hypothetical protein [Pseudomonas syringae pv. actinidifoliorum]
MLRVGMPFWTLCLLFVALRVTQRFGDFSVTLRLKSPFSPLDESILRTGPSGACKPSSCEG